MAEKITQPAQPGESRHTRENRGKGAAAAYHARRAAEAARAEQIAAAVKRQRMRRATTRRNEGKCFKCSKPVRGEGQETCREHATEIQRRYSRKLRIEKKKADKAARSAAWHAAKARREALAAGANPAYLEFGTTTS